MKRRDFIKSAGAAAGIPTLTAGILQRPDSRFDPQNEKGLHPILKRDHPYIFIDSCMQIWPDADFKNAHRTGATIYGVTAWDPHLVLDKALESLMAWHLIARTHPGLYVVTQAEDIVTGKKNSQAGLLLASQCGDFIGTELHRIEAFYRLGLRMLIPAYSLSNRICGGCLDRSDGGLTSFGSLVVDECNRVGMLLDCSHLGRRSSLDIIEHSSQPVVFSHSNANALAENPRNIYEDQIKACTSRGGIIGLTPWGPMLLKKGQTHRPTLDQFIEQIDYMAQLTGSVEHIGVGTDMSLGTYPDHDHDVWGRPEYKDVTSAYDSHITPNIRSPLRMAKGFDNYAKVVDFAERLQIRGYSETDTRKILGENYLRIFSEVWK